MGRAIPDGLVDGYEELIAGITLPDPDDRHVLAAAIRGGASVIVTFNQRDFPADVLASFGVASKHPDEFVENLFDLDAAAVLAAAQLQSALFKNPTTVVSLSGDPVLAEISSDHQGISDLSCHSLTAQPGQVGALLVAAFESQPHLHEPIQATRTSPPFAGANPASHARRARVLYACRMYRVVRQST